MKRLYSCAALSSSRMRFFMEYTPELNRALKELSQITGISIDIRIASEEDMGQAEEQIRCLCSAYKEKYNQNYFLLNLMKEGTPEYDLYDRASRLHIRPEVPRILFLLETRNHLEEIVTEVLKQLFPFHEKVYLVPVNKYQLAVLYPVKESISTEEIYQVARTIVDTLNTEALTHVQLAYSDILSSLSELSAAYQQVSLALKVGKLFYSEQTIFPHNQLGIGRLIYQLPRALCEDFLAEIFGDDRELESFDAETLLAVDKFFQNNLNIAETSRQLHMHRNTLIYRLDQIEKKTGLDLRQFEDAMTFKITIMIMNYLQTERNN